MKERKISLPLRFDLLMKWFKTKGPIRMTPDCRKWMTGMRLSEGRLPERVWRIMPVSSGKVFVKQWRPLTRQCYRSFGALFPEGQLWTRNCLTRHAARLRRPKAQAHLVVWPPRDAERLFSKSGKRLPAGGKKR